MTLTKNKSYKKKIIRNPWFIVLFALAAIVIGSNICCSGNGSAKETNTTSKVVPPVTPPPAIETPAVVSLSEQNFDDKISKGVTLVDFWATWCKPCRRQGPIIEEVCHDMAGKVTIGKLDIDESPSIANRFGITSIPTIIIFKNGKAISQFVGLTEKQSIIDALNKQL